MGGCAKSVYGVSWLSNLFDARSKIAFWRHDYNEQRATQQLELSDASRVCSGDELLERRGAPPTLETPMAFPTFPQLRRTSAQLARIQDAGRVPASRLCKCGKHRTLPTFTQPRRRLRDNLEAKPKPGNSGYQLLRKWGQVRLKVKSSTDGVVFARVYITSVPDAPPHNGDVNQWHVNVQYMFFED